MALFQSGHFYALLYWRKLHVILSSLREEKGYEKLGQTDWLVSVKGTVSDQNKLACDGLSADCWQLLIWL